MLKTAGRSTRTQGGSQNFTPLHHDYCLRLAAGWAEERLVFSHHHKQTHTDSLTSTISSAFLSLSLFSRRHPSLTRKWAKSTHRENERESTTAAAPLLIENCSFLFSHTPDTRHRERRERETVMTASKMVSREQSLPDAGFTRGGKLFFFSLSLSYCLFAANTSPSAMLPSLNLVCSNIYVSLFCVLNVAIFSFFPDQPTVCWFLY